MMTWVSPEVLRKFLNRTTVAMMVGWVASSVLKPPSAVMNPSKPVSMDWSLKPAGPLKMMARSPPKCGRRGGG